MNFRIEKDAYWFPHDSNAKDDEKCLILIEELGLEGYGIFWVLVETLRDQKDFKAPLRILPALARRYNTSLEKMKAVVTRYDLFEVVDEKFFFSESLQRRMAPFIEKKRKAKIDGIKGNLIQYNYATREELEGMTDEEIIDLNEQKKGTKALQTGRRSGSESGPGRNNSTLDNNTEDNKYTIDCDFSWDGEQSIDYTSFVDRFNELYDRSLRITDGKRENIRSRLRDFTGAEILHAWQNRLNDDWLNGREGSDYMGNWAAAMRNSEKVDKYLNNTSSGLLDDSKYREVKNV